MVEDIVMLVVELELSGADHFNFFLEVCHLSLGHQPRVKTEPYEKKTQHGSWSFFGLFNFFTLTHSLTQFTLSAIIAAIRAWV